MLKHTAIILLGFALTTAGLVSTGPALAQDNPPPAQVMVLGTFHFTGGGQDMINSEVDDFLAPHRQAEIEAVLDRLEAFAPTRIAVELTPEHEAAFNAGYAAYRAGELELGVNERQQIGMRLAARLGHDRLYAVDSQGGMDFDAMLSGAAEAGQTRLLADWEAYIGEVQVYMADMDSPEHTILQRLIQENSAETADYHDLYLLLAQMGSTENPAGAREMTRWWGRNLEIFANVARIAEPGERVLVIYGSGHKRLLDDFVDNTPNLTWVDPLPWLEAPH